MPAPLSPPPATDTGALTFPRQLQRWLDINPVTKLTRVNSYITLPAFSVNVTWGGYSDIVASFNYEGPNNFSLKSAPIAISPNYVPCIMWRDQNGNVHRYALWLNVGEVFYFNVPLYTGQKVAKNFRFEIWSTNSSPAVNTAAFNIYTSVLGGIDYRWGGDFVLVNNDAINTTFDVPMNGTQAAILVSGAGTASLNGVYALINTYAGRPRYYQSVDLFYPTLQKECYWNGFEWVINDNAISGGYYSTNNVATPDLVATWNLGANVSNPVPTVTTILGAPLPLTFPAGSYPQLNTI